MSPVDEPQPPIPAPDAPHAYVAVRRTHSPNADRPEWERDATVIPDWDYNELDYRLGRGYTLLPIGPDGDTGTRAITEEGDLAARVIALQAAVDSKAGWRPPAREITTAAERDALPVGTLVRSDDGFVAVRVNAHSGKVPGRSTRYPWDCIVLPVTVVYVPTEEAGRGDS